MNKTAVGILRALIGIAQMTMALVTLGLYLNFGLNRWSVGSLVVTMLLVIGSRVTFEERPFFYAREDMKKFGAEFIGTFALVFAGTGAIVINETSGGAITHVGIALTFGLIILAMIYTLGDISGAHLNPAVTLGFWFSRRLAGRKGCRTWRVSVQARSLRAVSCAPLPAKCVARHNATSRTRTAVIRARVFAHGAVDVRHPRSLDRRERERHHCRNRCRFSHRSRSHVRRSDLRRLDESGTLARPGCYFRTFRQPMDLPPCAGARRSIRCARMPLRSRGRMLFCGSG